MQSMSLLLAESAIEKSGTPPDQLEVCSVSMKRIDHFLRAEEGNLSSHLD